MKYTVMPGDTLFQIANRYGTTVDELLKANPEIKDPDLIFPGQVIEVPAATVPGDEIPAPEYPPGFPPGYLPGFTPGLQPGFPTGPVSGTPGPVWPPVCPGYLPGYPVVPDFPAGYFPYMPGMTQGGMSGMIPPVYPVAPVPGLAGMPGAAVFPYDAITHDDIPAVKLGSRGPHIKYLQGRLRELGYYRGPVTGCFGPRTKFAVRKFQRDCNVPDNGIVDRSLLASIGWYR